LTTVMRVSSYAHISDKHSHWTYATHETRAHDKPASQPARRARRSVLGRRRGSGRVTSPARHVSGLSAAPLQSSRGPPSIARRSLTYILRTLTTPREPTAITHSGAREELNLRLLVGRAEPVAAEVARRALADRLVRVRHQQGGSTSQRSGRREPGERSNARPAMLEPSRY
jgi:hypothetical protein